MRFKEFLLNESRESFFSDLKSWGVWAFDPPIYAKEYESGMVTLELQPTKDGLRLSYIKANPPKSGVGSKFMEDLVKKADEHDIPIYGSVQSEEGGPDDQKLREFYRRFGFEISGSDMVRKPNFKTPVIKLRGFNAPRKRSDLAELSDKYDWVVSGEHESGWDDWEDAVDAIWDITEFVEDLEDFKYEVYGEPADDTDLANFINDELEKRGVEYRVNYTGEDEDY